MLFSLLLQSFFAENKEKLINAALTAMLAYEGMGTVFQSRLKNPVWFFQLSFGDFGITRKLIFFSTHGKFHTWKVCLKDINENLPGYGNHN